MMLTIFVLLASFIFFHTTRTNFKHGVFLLLASLPAYLIRFSIGPLPTTLLEVFLLVLIVCWVVKRGGLRMNGTRLDGWRMPIALMVLAATIGILVSPDKTAALGVWKAYIIEPILFFFIVLSTLKTKKDIRHALQALGAGVIFVSLFAIFQWLTGIGIPIPWDTERRITSFYEFPNAVGLFVGPLVTIGLVFLYHSMRNKAVTVHKNLTWKIPGGRQTLFWGTVVVLGAVAVVFSKTEAAWIAIPGSLFVLTLFNARLRKVSIPVAIVLAILLFAIPVSREKLLLQDTSGLIRQSQWTETMYLLRDRPVFGAGMSGYPILFEAYHVKQSVPVFQYPHNILLNFWVELGLLGLLAVWYIIWQVTKLVKPILTTKTGLTTPKNILTIALLGALIEILIHGLVDVPYFKNDLAILTWTLLALLALARTVEQTKKE